MAVQVNWHKSLNLQFNCSDNWGMLVKWLFLNEFSNLKILPNTENTIFQMLILNFALQEAKNFQVICIPKMIKYSQFHRMRLSFLFIFLINLLLLHIASKITINYLGQRQFLLLSQSKICTHEINNLDPDPTT